MRNYVELIGRAGADPVFKVLEKGTEFASMNIATTESYLDKDKQRVEVTDWHTVVGWRGVAKSMSHIKKGKLVCVIGKMKTRKYTDKNNVEKYITEVFADDVIFLERMQEGTKSEPEVDGNRKSNKSDISMI